MISKSRSFSEASFQEMLIQAEMFHEAYKAVKQLGLRVYKDNQTRKITSACAYL